MRRSTSLVSAVLGLVPLAPAQRFGFSRQMLPADGNVSNATALGDVDGDGDLDAYVGNGSLPLGEQDHLYLNDGTGVFSDVTATNLPLQSELAAAVTLGDVDGDGDLDVLLGRSGGPIGLFLNGGAGVFADVTTANLPAFFGYAWAVPLGDVDGDGDLDAFAGTSGQSLLLLNGGAGTFNDVTATNLPVFLGYTSSVALGDVDVDGDLDGFLGQTGGPLGAQDRLYLNGGTGVFANVTGTNLPAVIDSTNAVALGDLDGDGDLDGFVGNLGQPNRLFLNGGAGAFSDATSAGLPPGPAFTCSLALGDAEGDGDIDVFAGSAALADFYVNGGAGTFTVVAGTGLLPAGSLTRGIGLGDVDGDGDLDGLFATGAQDRLLLNEGTGVFSEVSGTNLPAGSTGPTALGDFDADGDLDAFGGGGGSPDRLFRNEGNGVFTDATAANLPTPPLYDSTVAVAVAAGDVDGDGDLDLFLGNQAGADRLLLNAGTGVFADATASNLPTPVYALTEAVALGDVDGDGDLDALLGVLGQSRLSLNGGAGVFANATAGSLPTLIENTWAVALGDVDGDGDLDALLGNSGPSLGNSGAQSHLLQNGGAGAFTDVTATGLPALSEPTKAVALGDVDGDGDLDALLGNVDPSGLGVQDRLLLNGGTGAFVDATATNMPALFNSTWGITLGDADEDGDLDAFLAIAGESRLYLNGGGGIFLDATATDFPPLREAASPFALGDLDGDGDLDAFRGGSGQNRVYTNLSRQLAWRGIPRAGKPLVLDLHGPAWGAWFLGLALGTASVPIPPFGTLRIDPTLTFPPLGGIFDAEGRATVTNAVPANPALVGSTLYWQALVVGAGFPRFTNLEITTVTNL